MSPGDEGQIVMVYFGMDAFAEESKRFPIAAEGAVFSVIGLDDEPFEAGEPRPDSPTIIIGIRPLTNSQIVGVFGQISWKLLHAIHGDLLERYGAPVPSSSTRRP